MGTQMKIQTKIGLVAIALMASACQTTMDQPSEMFGASVKHNIKVQTIEPTEEQKQNTYIRPDSQRMAKARERYRKDDVEKPEDLQTTD